MKKYFLSIFMCIIVGVLLSRILFNQYNTNLAFKNEEKAYFFLIGKYKNMEDFKDSNKYDSYIYIKTKDGYYIYTAITKDNYEKVQNYMDRLGYKTTVEEKNVNSKFLSRLKEYDDRLKETDNTLDIKRIISDILKSYEELIKSEN